MPRASWNGFLRISLVSCPFYLFPATTRSRSGRIRSGSRRSRGKIRTMTRANRPGGSTRGLSVKIVATMRRRKRMAGTRVSLLPHDPHTGAEIERGEVIKGYGYERGGFVTFTADELKALDVESSKIIEFESFVPRVRSTRSISALLITSIRMARSRSRPFA
jgi:DNA end-binding protein Ku